MNKEVVYVVLLNWNGWSDTIACLESLFASINVPMRVVVCDNASTDESLDKIEAWAVGLQQVEIPSHPRLSRLLSPCIENIKYKKITREEAEQGSDEETNENCPSLILIENGANIGFAAGNNVGLRYALAQPDMGYVWLLNNDTLVEPDCLQKMLARLADSEVDSVCGSMIHFFDQPEIIQAVGGNRFNVMTGCAACSEGRFSHEDSELNIKQIEATIDYISGCSLLMPRNFLESVGLMSEDYFLYYEEIDWFTRAKGRYNICIADDAIIYHREGAAIGSKNWQSGASILSDFHMFRSRLIYMRKYYGRFLSFCYLDSFKEALKRLFRGQYRHAWVVISVLLGRKA